MSCLLCKKHSRIACSVLYRPCSSVLLVLVLGDASDTIITGCMQMSLQVEAFLWNPLHPVPLQALQAPPPLTLQTPSLQMTTYQTTADQSTALQTLLAPLYYLQVQCYNLMHAWHA